MEVPMEVKMDVGHSVLVILGLMVLSAFFAGAETALTGASAARMHALEKEGNKKAGLVNLLRKRKEQIIGAMLFGNTMVNILCSALATSLLVDIFGDAGIVYATMAMTLLLLIFAEVMPKTYALHHADGMAMKIAPVVKFLIILFSPVVGFVSWVVRGTLKLFGTDIAMVSPGHHIEVLRGAIEMHRGEEEGTHEQRAMLRSILDLADVEVGEIMTHRKNMTTLDASQPMDALLDEILKSPYTRLPVWKDSPDNIIGIVHVRLLLKEVQSRGGNMTGLGLESVMAEPWFIPESTPLFDQLQAFRERREHFALVVDEYGALMGMLTLEDILEEIVGDIDDEVDEIVAGVRKQANGSYMIDGTVTIRDINWEFEWNLPADEEYSTLAGLILHESQMVPDVGRIFQFYDFTFEVVRRQRNQITLIRVMPPTLKSPGQTTRS